MLFSVKLRQVEEQICRNIGKLKCLGVLLFLYLSAKWHFPFAFLLFLWDSFDDYCFFGKWHYKLLSLKLRDRISGVVTEKKLTRGLCSTYSP